MMYYAYLKLWNSSPQLETGRLYPVTCYLPTGDVLVKTSRGDHRSSLRVGLLANGILMRAEHESSNPG